MPSPPSTRPSGSRERRSSAFVREDSVSERPRDPGDAARPPGSASLLLTSPLDGPHTLAPASHSSRSSTPPAFANAARASYLLMTDVLGTIALHVAELDADTYPLDD